VTAGKSAVQPLVVIDSSALVALFTDAGDLGEWVARSIAGAALSAPQLVQFECANILRRKERSGEIDASAAALAHADLLALPVKLWPYSLLAERAWQLRKHVTVYDAAYVALAELIAAPLVTLDQRLGRTHGVRCEFQLPP
jgi:predicted nucleic acid-binding protein